MFPRNIHEENGAMGHLIVWILDENDKLIQYQLQLLARQQPSCFLTCLLRYRFDRPQLCQDISGLIPMDRACSINEPDPGHGRAMLLSITEALIDAADKLFPIRQIALHPSMIYLNQEFQVKLAFWPVMPRDDAESQQDEFEEIRRLIRLIGHACRIPADETDMMLQSISEGNLSNLLAVLKGSGACKDERDLAGACREKARQGVSGRVNKLFQILREAICRVVKKSLQAMKRIVDDQERPDGQPEDYQTVLLAADPDDFKMAMLAEGKPGTPEENEGIRAFILVDEFVVGRDPRLSDLCLPDPGIGRIHARICRKAGSFFISDLGSKNGTKLDGKRLHKNTEALLPDRCIVQFAERPFFFVADGC